MKKCPQCGRDYNDDLMSFCLDDGSELLFGPAQSQEFDEPQTAILHETAPSGEAATRAQIHTTERTAVLPSGFAITPKAKGFDPRLLLAPLVLLVIALGGFLGYRYLMPGTSQIESIAVMPFVNESNNEEVEYLSDGMTETLIKSLSNLPNLAVKSRSTVFYYKGKETSPQKIGEELKVQAVLLGRVSQRGNDLKLNLELVNTQTQDVIWTEEYNRKQSDLVTLQSEIASDVSTKLKSKLSATEEKQVANVYTTNSEAYQLYLKGNFYTTKLTKEGFRKGNEYFERAIQLDPDYALAYNGIAFNQLAAMDWFSAPKVAGPKAKNAVEKAFVLNDKLAETHLLRGMVAHWVDWDWATAENAFRQAIELNPSGYRPYGYYAWFLANIGRNDEAVAFATKGQQLDPISAEANWYLGMALIAAGRTDEAIARLQTAIDLEPSYFYAYTFLGRAHLQAGNNQEALKAFERAYELESENLENLANLAYAQGVNGNKVEAKKAIDLLLETSNNEYVSPYYLAIAYAGLGETEHVFTYLERAYEDRSDSLILYFTADPQMDGIRSDPRYKDLLKRTNLPE